ncbi:winged helix DNA-binding domain-containing protein [Flavobacterium selenitireducens]|uniref:winged helix DNA-binding domain-containing protein n=1 Tax=Flavobacterium selenitireducens TaxID=2722704 RepID=UPI00168A7A92|nr:winged helix DNA-binding domain-containing protein [Flavobacterium selenitireducens]MBD3582626.1 winged helix DNA-binding domain-containing protein [Flavobacterium selenitireducens]
MDFTDISQQRLQNQQLLSPQSKSIAELVRHFGAIQAQDYAMAKWAIGSRLADIVDADVDLAIANGEIVRTHVLRPTWHFCASEDIGWMLELSAKNIRGQMASNDKKLGLDQELYNKCFKLIEKALEAGHLSRPQIMEILEYNGIRTHDYRGGHIMAAAELEGLVVSGKRIGNEHGYALMSEQVRKPRRLSREEALSQLAATYFTSHGPATIRDFQWWSGLNLTNCRQAIASNESVLENVVIEGQEYFFSEVHPNRQRSTFLLPAFDEFLISYKDRTPSIASEHQKHAFTMNGIFKPIVVVDGQVCGIWKRTVKKDQVIVETDLVYKIPQNRLAELRRQAHRFSDFLGKTLEFKA